MKFLDLTGKTFGRWTVIELHSKLGTLGGTRWLCRCNCGIEKAVQAGSLTQGLSTSCGCYNREVNIQLHRPDHTGKRFGRWTALDYVASKDAARWLCRCDCGTERVLFISTLVSGYSSSCG